MEPTKGATHAPTLPQSTEVLYQVDFTTDVEYRLRAYLKSGAYTFKVQTFDATTGLGAEADTTGKVASGPMGVISIEAPAAVKNLIGGAKSTAVTGSVD